MNEKHTSFLICYLMIPIIFYAADGFLHSHVVNDRVEFLLIQFGLPAVAWLSFKFILGNRSLKINKPISAAWGASIGLVHWFPIYFELASRYIWEPVGGRIAVDSRDILLFSVNLVLPVVTFSGSTYDATLMVIPLSMILFFWAATKKIGSDRLLDFGFKS